MQENVENMLPLHLKALEQPSFLWLQLDDRQISDHDEHYGLWDEIQLFEAEVDGSLFEGNFTYSIKLRSHYYHLEHHKNQKYRIHHKFERKIFYQWVLKQHQDTELNNRNNQQTIHSV